MAKIYRALEAFAYVDPNGYPMPVTPGTLVSGDDPAYKSREHLFESVEDSVVRTSSSRASETATSGPGELRARARLGKRLTKAEKAELAVDENTPPQGAKNFDPPPQAVDGGEPEPPDPPTTGAVNFDPKPQTVDGPENTEPEPTGDKNSDPKPQAVDGGEPKGKK